MRKAVLLFCFILLGCFSTPESKFYMLNSLPIEKISSTQMKIGVYDVSLPEYADKPQIVLQNPESPEITISEFNRWGTDLSVMVKNTFIEDLQKALPDSKVYPLAYGTNFQYIVKIDVEKFTGWLNKQALFKVKWQILNSRGKPIYTESSEYQTDVGKTYALYVLAQSKLLADLSADIANKLKTM